MPPSLTFYFIVEPPDYSVMACYLAASLRQQFGQSVKLIGYCPSTKIGAISPNVIETLRRMDCQVLPFSTENRFTPPYPHGNKLLATLEPRDTEFSAFVDSDVLFLLPNKVENIIKPGHISLTPAASMKWGRNNDWDAIYAVCGMSVPAERIRLMRQSGRQQRVPYFSAGLFTFPEQHRNDQGKNFAETWMDTAQTLDANPDVPAKRPYLDQISLPLAIQRSGLGWNLLPEEQHYILGGKLRGEPLPTGRDIFTVHYRRWTILTEVGLVDAAESMLERQAGARRPDLIGQS